MSIEKSILDTVEKAFETNLEKLMTAIQSKSDNSTLITVKQASKILSCSCEYVRMLQDRGTLDLYFLPDSKHRRVKKIDVIELMEKSKVHR